MDHSVRSISFATVTLLWAVGAAAQPWIPQECADLNGQSRREFERLIHEAKPDSPIYAPRPFPRTEAEIIEDFKYGYKKIIAGKQVSTDQMPLAQAVDENTLAFRIPRVENWTPNRCRPGQQMDFYLLLYVTDSSTGREVSRFVLNQSGLVAEWTTPPTKEQETEAWAPIYRGAVVPKLGDALKEVQSRYGIAGARPQYVATWGNPECAIVAPCVAFQSQGKVFLFGRGDLVEFSAASHTYTPTEMNATRTRRFEITRSINPQQECLVSITDARWVVAKKVKPRK